MAGFAGSKLGGFRNGTLLRLLATLDLELVVRPRTYGGSYAFHAPHSTIQAILIAN